MKNKITRMLKVSHLKRRYLCYCILLVLFTGLLLIVRQRSVERADVIRFSQYDLKKSEPMYTNVMHEREPDDIRQRLGQRHQRVKEYCKKNEAQYEKSKQTCSGKNPVEVNSYSLSHYGLFTCVIPHNADIILKQTLQMLVTSSSSSNFVKNPFLFTDFELSGYTIDKQQLSIPALLKSGVSKSFTIVRDPYARILSYYMDNLYMPNSWAWRTLAKNIRPRDKRSCINDIAFEEFVHYFLNVMSNDPCSSEVLLSNTQYSDPCSMQYAYIGKYEYLEKELNHILTDLRLMKSISIPHFKTDYDTLMITRYVDILYRQTEDVLQDCEMDFTMAANRLWRLLQGKGIMGRYDALPLNYDKIPKSKMQTLMLSSYLNGQDFDRKDNVEMLLSEAYSKISMETIGILQTVFKLDFEIYGYEPFPEYIRKGIANKKNSRPKFLKLE